MNIFRKLLVISLCLVATGLLPSMVECKESAPSEIELIGEVIKKSELPDPSTAAYPDCLTLFKFKVIKVTKGKFDNAEALVAMWGFRGYKLSEPGKFKIGDKIKLQIVPYTKVENELSGIMRVDDTQDYDSELYWAPAWEAIDSVNKEAKDANATMLVNSNKLKTDIVGKVLRILKAHQGEVIGGPESKMLFGDYGYLITDGFWLKPEVKKNVRQVGILDAIVDFNNYLESKNIRLVVLFPPSPIAIYPELAANVDYNFDRDGRIDLNFVKFTEELRKRGVTFVDLLPDFVRNKWYKGFDGQVYPLYLQNDIHWNSIGASLAGNIVARSIKKADWFQNIAKDYSPTVPSFREVYSVETYEKGYYVKKNPEWNFPHPTYPKRSVVPNAGSEFISNIQDVKSPIWVLGDSFSSQRFEEFYNNVSIELGMPARVVSYAGGSSTAVREEFARGDTSSVRIVIWEIAYPFLSPFTTYSWKEVVYGNEKRCDLTKKLAESVTNTNDISADNILLYGLSRDGIRLPQLKDSSGKALPVNISWRSIRLGKKPVFSTQIGLELSDAAKSDGLKYVVLVNGKVIASQTLDKNTSPQPSEFWTQSWDIDLSNFAGKTIEFQLKVDPLSNWDGERAFWGNPKIEDGTL